MAHPKQLAVGSPKKKIIHVLIAQFIIAKKKQPTNLSLDGETNTMWFTHAMEHYPAFIPLYRQSCLCYSMVLREIRHP